MTKKLNIPTDPEAITLDWLTEALRSTGIIKQTTVTSLSIERLGAGPGFVGQLIRFRLDYTLVEESAPTSVIAKLSSADQEVRTTLHKAKIYEKEIRFYQELASQAHLGVPRSYYADINLDTGHSILLLEDLSHLRAVDISIGCNLTEAELVIRHLAQFHARWWESPQLQATAYLTPFNYIAEFWQERYQGWWPQFSQKIETLLPDYQLSPAFLDLGHRFGPFLAKIFSQLNQPPITLVHKDTHVENLLFSVNDNDAPLMFLDWQLFGYGRGVSDVTYFMITSIPIPLRRQVESSLLQTYHSHLMKHGVQGYDFEQCWTDYQHAFFRVLQVVTTVVSMLDMSRPHGLALLEAVLPRTVAFSEDHRVSKFL